MARQLAGFLLTCALNFNLFCLLHGHYSEQFGRKLFVSISGKDNKTCGSPDMPCRTIVQGVKQGAWGDTIYLDGTGTKQQPYDCPTTTPDIPGIHVTKSLSIIGYLSVAHVSCTSGLFFKATNGREDMLATLSGIMFWRTTVVLRNCSIQIAGCTFRDTQDSAVNLEAENIAVFLVIRDTLFINNSLCISANFDDQVHELNVRIEIKHTMFHRNGLMRSASSGSGGILISKSFTSDRLMHVRVRCYNVSYVENQGPFMNIDILTAITSESYIEMRVVNNSINRIYREATLGGIWQSLYCSRAISSNVSFTSFRCQNNSNARCVGFSSEDLSLKIRDSFFSGQHLKDGNGGALFITRPEKSVNITLENTDFERNSAEEGGCVFVDNGNGTVNLGIFNVSFTQCQAYTQGSAVIVGRQGEKPHSNSGIRELFANFRNISVVNCRTYSPWKWWKQGAICLYVRVGNRIEFDHVHWIGNIAPSCPALFVGNSEGSVQIQISGSLLVENWGSFGHLCTASLVPDAGSITVRNTQIFPAKSIGMRLDPFFNISLQNVTVLSSDVALFIRGNKKWYSDRFPNPTVDITNCLFKDNTVVVFFVFNCSSGGVTFRVKDSIFSGPMPPPKTSKEGQRGIYSILFSVLPTSEKNISGTVVSIENVTVDSITSFVFNLQSAGNVTMQVRRSTFKNCTILCLYKGSHCDPRTLQYGGAMTIIFGPDQRITKGCTTKDTHENMHPTWTYDSHVIFEDTTFEENEGLYAGAVYLTNGFASFRRCAFKNNFALQRGGHVYATPSSGQVELISSTFNQTKTISRPRRKVAGPQFVQFLYSESSGRINITNTSMSSNISTTNSQPVLDIAEGGYVDMNSDSHIYCPIGSKLTLENLTHFTITNHQGKTCKLNQTVLRYSCGLCPPGMYSLQKGSTSGLLVQADFQCLPCPYGASCIRNIVAKPNFWGHLVSANPPSLNFTFCPEEYCSPPQDADPSVYNGCHGNRSGVLCGGCRKGYTESLFSTQCRLVEECSNIWFWLATGIALVCFTCYLVRKPPLLTFLRRQILWFRPQSNEYHVLEEDLGHSQHSASGYLKITFYFYQVADLLLVGSLTDVVHRVPFVFPLVGLFKLQIQAFDERLGCPFAGLTAITKELFMSTGYFAVMTIAFVIYVLHRVLNVIRGQDRPHPIRYLAVALETLLLSYERLTETALKLLHCVPLSSDWRLFYDGNESCWQWWQTVLLFYILAFLLPFIGILYWGSLLLYEKRISVAEFLGACALPLPFLCRWAALRHAGRLKDQVPEERSGKEVLEILHGPFRSPSDHDQGTLYWESVLTGRRFILLSFHAFIRDPMMRLACMTSASMLMAFHHVIKRPYRDPKANRVATASLLVLALIGVMNLARASFVSAGVDPGGPTQTSFVVFQWLQVVWLAFAPGLVVLLAIFAVFSQLLRLMIFLASMIMLLVRSLR